MNEALTSIPINLLSYYKFLRNMCLSFLFCAPHGESLNVLHHAFVQNIWAPTDVSVSKALASSVFPLFQALLFEKSNFGGQSLEVDSDVFSLLDGGGEEAARPDKEKTLSAVGSIKILGGL